MSRFPAESLYRSLPAHFRSRDQEQGEPLRALMAVIEEELERLRNDVEGLYDDAFLETAAEWVVPYLADLLGFDTVGDEGFAGAHPRTQVASVLGYRRRKGTSMVLERTCHDVTGFFARAVESFRRLAHTQSVLVPRPDRGGTYDVRYANAPEREASPFAEPELFRTIDLRPPDGQLQRTHVRNLHLALWRLLAMTVEDSPAPESGAVPSPTAGTPPRGFHLDPLERDLRLFNRPEKPVDMVRLPEDYQLPIALGLDDLDRDLRAFRRRWAPEDPNLRPAASGFYGDERGLDVAVDGVAIPPADVVARSLGNWGAIGVVSSDLAAAAALTPPFDLARPELEITLGAAAQTAVLAQLPATLAHARELLAAAAGASAAVFGRRLLIVSETSGESVAVAPTVADPTTAADLQFTDATGGEDLEGLLSGDVDLPLSQPKLRITFGGTTRTVTLAGLALDVEQAAQLLEDAIRAVGTTGDAYARARVYARGDRLLLIPGDSVTPVSASSATGDTFTARDLKLLVSEGAETVTGLLSGDLSTFPLDPTDPATAPRLMGQVTMGGKTAFVRMPTPGDIHQARHGLECALRFTRHEETFREARVWILDERLLVIPGTAGDDVTFQVPTEQESGTAELSAALALDVGTPYQALYSAPLPDPLFLRRTPRLTATLGGTDAATVTLERLPADLDDARELFETALRRAGDEDVFRHARVAAVRTSGGDDKLFVVPGVAGQDLGFTNYTGDAPPSADELGLSGAPLEQARLSGEFSADLTAFPVLAAAPAFDATLGGEGPHRVALGRLPTATVPSDAIDELASILDRAFEAAHPSPVFRDARVTRVGDRLVFLPGIPGDEVVFDDGEVLSKLGLDALEPAFGAVTGRLEPFPELRRPELEVSIGSGLHFPIRLDGLPDSATDAAALLRAAVRSVQDRPAFRSVRVVAVDGTRLLAVAGTADAPLRFHRTVDDPTAEELGLVEGTATPATATASGELARQIVLSGTPALAVAVGGGAPTDVSFTPASNSPEAVAAALETAIGGDVRVAAVAERGAEDGETVVRLLLFELNGQEVTVAAAAANPATVNEVRLAGADRRFEGVLSAALSLPLQAAPAIAFTFGAGAAVNAVLSRRPHTLDDARALLDEALTTAGASAQVLRLGDRLAVISNTVGEAVSADVAPAGAANIADDSTALLLDFAWRAAVDPRRARLLLRADAAPAGADPPAVTHTWAQNGRIGGGPYDRRDTLVGETGSAAVFDVEKGGALATLGAALVQAGGVEEAVIRVLDNGLYEEDLAIDLASGTLRDLVIEAEDGRRPVLRPATAGTKLTVTGGEPESRLRINGLLIDAELELAQRLRLEIVHTTLVPVFGRPSLSFNGPDDDALELEVRLESSIAGTLRLPATMVLVEVEGSLVDAGGIEGGAEPMPALVSEPLASPLVLTAGPELELALGGGAFLPVKLERVPRTLAEAREALEQAIRVPFADATVEIIGRRLLVRSNATPPQTVEFGASPNDVLTLDELALAAPPAVEYRGLFSGDLSGFVPFTLPRLRLTVGDEGPHLIELDEFPADLANAVARLETKLAVAVDRDAVTDAAFAGTEILGLSGHLLLLPGEAFQTVFVDSTGADTRTADDLKLLAPEARNVSGILSGTIDFTRFEKPRVALLLEPADDRQVVTVELPWDVAEVAAYLQTAIRAIGPSYDSVDVVRLGDQLLVRPETEDQRITFENIHRFDLDLSWSDPTPGTATASLAVALPQDPGDAAARLEAEIHLLGTPFDTVDVQASGDRLVLTSGHSDRTLIWTEGPDRTSAAADFGLTGQTRVLKRGILSAPLEEFPILSRPQIEITNPAAPELAALRQVPTTVEEARRLLEDALQRAGSVLGQEVAALRAAVVLDIGRRLFLGVEGFDVNVAVAFADDPTAEELGLTNGSEDLQGYLSGAINEVPSFALPEIVFTLGNDEPRTVTLPGMPVDLRDAADLLEQGLRTAHPVPSYLNARVAVTGDETSDQRLLVVSGNREEAVSAAASESDATTVVDLRLESPPAALRLGVLSGNLLPFPPIFTPGLTVTISGETHEVTLHPPLATVTDVRISLANALRAVATTIFLQSEVREHRGRLLIVPDSPGATVTVAGTAQDAESYQQLGFDPGTLRRGLWTEPDKFPVGPVPPPQLEVKIANDGPLTVTFDPATLPTDPASAAVELQKAIRAAGTNPPYLQRETFAQAVVLELGGRLAVQPGLGTGPVVFTDGYPPATALKLTPAEGARNGILSGDLSPFPSLTGPALEVSMGGGATQRVELSGDLPTTPADAATALETALQTAFSGAAVTLLTDRLAIRPAAADPDQVIAAAAATTPADSVTVEDLGFSSPEAGLLGDVATGFSLQKPEVDYRKGGTGAFSTASLTTLPADVPAAAAALNTVLTGIRALSFTGLDRLFLLPDPIADQEVEIQASSGDATTAVELELTTGAGAVLSTGVVSGVLASPPTVINLSSAQVNFTLNATPGVATLGTTSGDLDTLAAALETALGTAGASVWVVVLDNQNLLVVPQTSGDTITFQDGSPTPTAVNELLLGSAATVTQARVSDDLSTFPSPLTAAPAVEVFVDATSEGTANFAAIPADGNLTAAASTLETALNAVSGLSVTVTVAVVDDRLFVVPDDATRSLELRDVTGRPTTASDLDLVFNTSDVLVGASQSLVSTALSSPLTLRAAPALNVSLDAAPAVTVALDTIPTDLDQTVTALNTAFTSAGVLATALRVVDYLFVAPTNAGVAITLADAPAPNVPIAGDLLLLSPDGAETLLSEDISGFTSFSGGVQFGMRISGITATVTLDPVPADLATARSDLEAALNAAHSNAAFDDATVEILDGALFITPGGLSPGDPLDIEAIPSESADLLGLLDDPDGEALVIDGLLADQPFEEIVPPLVQIRVAIQGEGEKVLELRAPLTIDAAAVNLQQAIQDAGTPSTPGFAGTRVGALGTQLLVLPGVEDLSIGFSDVEGQDIQLATALLLRAEDLSPVRVLESGRIIKREPAPLRVTPELDVTFGDDGPHRTFFTRSPRTLPEARAILEQALHRVPDENSDVAEPDKFTKAKVRLLRGGEETGRFLVIPGADPGDPIFFASAGDEARIAELMKLDTSARRGEGLLSDALGLTGTGILFDDAGTVRDTSEVEVTFGANPAATLSFPPPTGPLAARAMLEQAIGAAIPGSTAGGSDGAHVLLFADGADQKLLVLPGPAEYTMDPSFAVTGSDGTTAVQLGLTTGAVYAGLLSGDVSPFPLLDPNVVDRRLDVTMETANDVVTLNRVPESLEAARDLLEEALRESTASTAFQNARVFIAGGKLLLVPGDDVATVTTVTVAGPAGVADEANLARGLRLDASDPDLAPVRLLISGPVQSLVLRSEVELQAPLGGPTTLSFDRPVNLEAARQRLETALAAVSTDARVFIVEDERLFVLPGPADRPTLPVFSASAADAATADALGLRTAAGAQAFTGFLRSGSIVFPLAEPENLRLTVTLGGPGQPTDPAITQEIFLAALPTDVAQARDLIEAAIRGVSLLNAPSFTGARALVVDDSLLVIPGLLGDSVAFADSDLARALGLAPVIYFPLDPAAGTQLTVTIGSGPGATQTLTLISQPTDLANARDLLEIAINIMIVGGSTYTDATVLADDENQRLTVVPGVSGDSVVFADNDLARALGFVPHAALLGGLLDGFPELTVTPRVVVALNDTTVSPPVPVLSGTMTLKTLPADLDETRDVVARALRALVDQDPINNKPFENVEWRVLGDRLLVLPGDANPDRSLDFTDTARGPNTAVELGLGRLNREPGHGLLSTDLADFDGIDRLTLTFDLTLGQDGPYQAALPGIPDDAGEAADFVAEAIRGAHAGFSFLDAGVIPVGTDRILISPGRVGDAMTIDKAAAGRADSLHLLGLYEDDQLNPPRPIPVGTLLSGDLSAFPVRVPPQLKVTINGKIEDNLVITGVPATLAELAAELENTLHTSAEVEFQNATVDVVESRLLVRSTDAGAVKLTAADILFEAATAEAGQRLLTVDRLRLGAAVTVAADGLLSGDLTSFTGLSAIPRLRLGIGDEGPFPVELLTVPDDLESARQALEDAVRAAHPSPAFREARVASSTAGGEERLILLPGREAELLVEPHPDDDTTVVELGLLGAGARQVGALVSAALAAEVDPGGGPQLTVTMIEADGSETEAVLNLTASGLTALAALAADLETQLRGAGAGAVFTSALAAVAGGDRLVLVPGDAGASITVAAPNLDTLTALGLVVLEAIGTAVALGAQGPPLEIRRSTVFGRVSVRELVVASEALFTAPLQVAYRQDGCVRYSYLPVGSRTPRRFRSQPDLALAEALAGVDEPAARARETRRVLARLRPVFTSTRFGDPAYGQLARAIAEELRAGSADGSELGVYQSRQEARRRDMVRALLNEFLRFGLEAGIIEMN